MGKRKKGKGICGDAVICFDAKSIRMPAVCEATESVSLRRTSQQQQCDVGVPSVRHVQIPKRFEGKFEAAGTITNDDRQ